MIAANSNDTIWSGTSPSRNWFSTGATFTLRDRLRGGGCDTLYLKLRPRNAVLGRVLIIATARRSLSDVAFARKWTNSRRLGSPICAANINDVPLHDLADEVIE